MPDHRTYYYVMDGDYNIVRRFNHKSIHDAWHGFGEAARHGQRGDTFLLTSTKGPFARNKPLYVHARLERLEISW